MQTSQLKDLTYLTFGKAAATLLDLSISDGARTSEQYSLSKLFMILPERITSSTMQWQIPVFPCLVSLDARSAQQQMLTLEQQISGRVYARALKVNIMIRSSELVLLVRMLVQHVGERTTMSVSRVKLGSFITMNKTHVMM